MKHQIARDGLLQLGGVVLIDGGFHAAQRSRRTCLLYTSRQVVQDHDKRTEDRRDSQLEYSARNGGLFKQFGFGIGLHGDISFDQQQNRQIK